MTLYYMGGKLFLYAGHIAPFMCLAGQILVKKADIKVKIWSLRPYVARLPYVGHPALVKNFHCYNCK